MQLLRTFCLLLVLSAAVSVFAQAGGSAAKGTPAGSAPQAQTTPQPAPTISGIVDRQISQLEKQIVAAAEAMPEDKFEYAPTNLNLKDSRDPMRSFAFEVKHVATANYAFWSPITGDPLPAGIKGPNGPEDIKTKAEIVKYLKDSYALGHKAAATLTGDNLLDQLPMFQGKAPRLYLATFAVAHGYDHYGQMALYLRMNGITPPASRTEPK
ncbi:MAG TPA: DinB family protein [Candidatus Angelobacter sp.]|nr:DinB family protein [Candidatus Angelobacter sp.]